MSEIVYIGLGSNLEDPLSQLITALKKIRQLKKSILLKISSFYRSKPWGGIEQPDFINAVIKLKTALPPLVLLQALLAIEKEQGRIRTVRFGPRTLDCDILLYGEKIIETADLTIPHPHLHCRPFVVFPLLEIAPQLLLPSGERLSVLGKALDMASIEKLTVSVKELSYDAGLE
jgi:2-amino-4-hydroxy-6-hydroxymethyldihydropteridine diphosphokinase